jgi:molybdopterin-containing oxidoreductase family iron-sulfur binding subunit
MSSLERFTTARTHWRSLEDLADTPEFRAWAEREFPLYADEMRSPNRRNFLKIMGASVAFAGFTACRWPAEEIVPFAHRPEEYVPGTPVRYATAMEISGVATGLLVTSYDGRPVKVEGNPGHPFSLGGTDVLAQAAVLELYDPDRSRSAARCRAGQDAAATWEEFESHLASVMAGSRGRGGAGLRVLSEASSSPTLEDLRARWLAAFPKSVWHEYEPLSRDAERKGAVLAFGKPYRVQFALDRARVVVTLDEDLVLSHPAAVRYSRDLAAARRGASGEMSRIYAVETAYTLTGAYADHRVALRPAEVPAFAARLAAELFLKQGIPLPAGAEGIRATLERFLEIPSPSPLLAAAARALADARGASVVAAGPSQPPEVHALAHLLNTALGNVGSTLRYTIEPDPGRPSHVESIRTLTADMDAGRVDALLILGGNPVFDAPADLEFGRRLARVANSFRLGLYLDETSRACGWHLPRAHWLESWGDARAFDGTISVVQPLIEPLWGGKSPLELLALALGEQPSKGYDLVRRTFKGLLGEPDFERRWRGVLNDGLLAGSGWAEERPPLGVADWPGRLGNLAAAAGARRGGMLDLVFCRDARIHDGRFANNGWLQELPDPLSKLTWDNAALLAPSDAKGLSVAQGDVIRVIHEGRETELPVFVLPGQTPGTLAVAVGYGRKGAGRVAEGAGVDVYRIRTSGAPWGGACRVEKTGRSFPLSTTQDHHVLDTIGIEERTRRTAILLREIDASEYASNPKAVAEIGPEHEEAPLWKLPQAGGHRWALAVDLSACVGCGACSVACQAENNIPVVGKDEVARGREMHWIRVDRYFSGPPEAPSVSHQPVACHHCENAPCEQVCPVAATVHDAEGLNVMVYNRCVGTRYCSNNCPYKVRRFNWFNHHKEDTVPLTMVYNPEVTVRSRGVMEKCTFCVQRINAAKMGARNDGRPVRDGDIATACEQVCPTRAIVFGDLADPESRVAKLHEDRRSYAMLDELNVKPRVKYLARLKNRSRDGEPPTEGKA